MPYGIERLTSNGNEPSKQQPETIESPTDPTPSERFRAQAEALLPQDDETSHEEYRVYKRRWFGLIQLILLNIVVSWDVCSFTVIVISFSELTRCF